MPPHRHRCRGPGPCLCAEFFQVCLLGSNISTLLIERVQDPRPEARMGVCICGDDFEAHEPVVVLDLPPRVGANDGHAFASVRLCDLLD